MKIDFPFYDVFQYKILIQIFDQTWHEKYYFYDMIRYEFQDLYFYEKKSHFLSLNLLRKVISWDDYFGPLWKDVRFALAHFGLMQGPHSSRCRGCNCTRQFWVMGACTRQFAAILIKFCTFSELLWTFILNLKFL